MLDIPFPFQGTCTATADPAVGSTCGVVTSIERSFDGVCQNRRIKARVFSWNRRAVTTMAQSIPQLCRPTRRQSRNAGR